MNTIERTKLRMSVESACLDTASLLKLLGEPLYHGFVSGFGKRDFTLVSRGDIEYWCDCITGQLYSMNLVCLSCENLVLVETPRLTTKRVPKPKKLNL